MWLVLEFRIADFAFVPGKETTIVENDSPSYKKNTTKSLIKVSRVILLATWEYPAVLEVFFYLSAYSFYLQKQSLQKMYHTIC